MPKIQIKRNQEWNNAARLINIYVDGVIRAKIANGDSLSIDIPTGVHTIYAQIDWCYSKELKLNVDKDQQLHLSGFKHGKWLMPLGITVIALFFILSFFINLDPKWGFFLSLPFLVIMLYYLTFGRKKYLELKLITLL